MSKQQIKKFDVVCGNECSAMRLLITLIRGYSTLISSGMFVSWQNLSPKSSDYYVYRVPIYIIENESC
jgi:hypothetical protein